MPTQKELAERRRLALERHRRRIYLEKHPLIKTSPEKIDPMQIVDGSCFLRCLNAVDCDGSCAGLQPH